jgi:hypothetical protein
LAPPNNMGMPVECEKPIMTSSRFLKLFFRVLSPSIFWGLCLIFFFLLAAEARSLGSVEDRIPVLESSREMNALDAVRPVRSNVQFSIRVLKVHSTIEEDFDGDDEDIPSACLEVCYLLVPTNLCEILIPETRVQHVQRGFVLFLFERPPPSFIPESPTA